MSARVSDHPDFRSSGSCVDLSIGELENGKRSDLRPPISDAFSPKDYGLLPVADPPKEEKPNSSDLGSPISDVCVQTSDLCSLPSDLSSPEVSVVMSVYNNEDTLPAALESVLSQAGVNLELIVVDDGSTDESAKILDDAANRDSRVKVVHKKNEGLTRALADGCSLATAPWIARQDADDLSLPGRLRAQLDRACQVDSPVMVVCGSECRSPEGDMLYSLIPPDTEKKVTERILMEGRSVCPHGAIFFSRTGYEAIGGYRREFYYAQDTDIVTRFAESGVVAPVCDLFYAFAFSPFSISTHASSIQKQFWSLIRQSHEARSSGKSDAMLLKEAEVLCQTVRTGGGKKTSPFNGFYFMGTCLLASRPDRAKFYFRKAFAIHPWSVKTWGRLVQTLIKTEQRPL